MIDIKTKKMKSESMVTRLLALSLIALGFLIPSLPVQAERTTTYYVSDALGSPIVAMDEQGDVLWRKSYLPYGKQGSVDPADDKDTAYTGKKLDRDTGLLYFGARWYDPEAGRFTGIDPVGFKESNPESFNRYAYVNNNPYRFIDPDGRQATTRADYADLLGPDDPGAKIAERAAQIGETAAAVGDAVDDIASDPTTYVGGGTLKAATLVGKAIKGKKIIRLEKKIEKQMGKRGWDRNSVNDTIQNPNRTVATRDTRWNSDGTRRNDPATAYIREDGHYVVQNDNDGTIVQISNRNKTNWKSPFE